MYLIAGAGKQVSRTKGGQSVRPVASVEKHVTCSRIVHGKRGKLCNPFLMQCSFTYDTAKLPVVYHLTLMGNHCQLQNGCFCCCRWFFFVDVCVHALVRSSNEMFGARAKTEGVNCQGLHR